MNGNTIMDRLCSPCSMKFTFLLLLSGTWQIKNSYNISCSVVRAYLYKPYGNFVYGLKHCQVLGGGGMRQKWDCLVKPWKSFPFASSDARRRSSSRSITLCHFHSWIHSSGEEFVVLWWVHLSLSVGLMLSFQHVFTSSVIFFHCKQARIRFLSMFQLMIMAAWS